MTVKLLLAASLRVWTVLVTAFGIAGLFLMKRHYCRPSRSSRSGVLLGVGGSVGALAVVVCRLAAVAAVGGARSLADGEVVADDGVGRPAPAVRLVLVLAFAQDDVDLVGLRCQGGAPEVLLSQSAPRAVAPVRM